MNPYRARVAVTTVLSSVIEEMALCRDAVRAGITPDAVSLALATLARAQRQIRCVACEIAVPTEVSEDEPEVPVTAAPAPVQAPTPAPPPSAVHAVQMRASVPHRQWRKPTLPKRIVSALREGEAVTAIEIRSRMGDGDNLGSVRTTLVRMAVDGLLVRVSKGVYGLPSEIARKAGAA